MNKLFEKYGKTAMVVGAAEGLGAAFARELTDRGFSLVLVDVKTEKMNTLAREFNGGTVVSSLTVDLATSDAKNLLYDAWVQNDCNLLVYNAAYGPVKKFLSNTEEELDIYWKVNMETTVSLVWRILKNRGNKRTGIMLLSSMAGFRGTQYVVPYAATKAFLWNFVEGCHYEFKEQPYDFCICCPGATATPNYIGTNPKKTMFTPNPRDPGKVAKEALNKMGKKLFVVPGFSNKMVHFIFSRLLPRGVASGMHNKTMHAMYVDVTQNTAVQDRSHES